MKTTSSAYHKERDTEFEMWLNSHPEKLKAGKPRKAPKPPKKLGSKVGIKAVSACR